MVGVKCKVSEGGLCTGLSGFGDVVAVGGGGVGGGGGGDNVVGQFVAAAVAADDDDDDDDAAAGRAIRRGRVRARAEALLLSAPNK